MALIAATTEEFSEHTGVAFIGNANSALAAPAPSFESNAMFAAVLIGSRSVQHPNLSAPSPES
jgi:hypothetical protein